MLKYIDNETQNTMKIQTPESQVTFPGRPLTFLESPEKGTLPFSCSFRKYQNELPEFLTLCSKDLRGGAGVKVILDGYKSPRSKKVNWKFYLSPDHPDYKFLTDYQKTKLASSTEGWVIDVTDSMEGYGGIEESWRYFIEAVKQGQSVIVDLSDLRPYGSTNHKGLTATGPIGDGTEDSNHSSFFAIYDAIASHILDGDILSLLQVLGTINSTLRRGGQYKNGIITSSMRWDNPEIYNYLNAPLVDIPGSHKKSVKYSDGLLNDESLMQLISDKRNQESVFLEPILADDLHANVCMAIYAKPNSTCLINRLNISQCTSPKEITEGMVKATLALCELHVSWRDMVGDRAKIYLPLTEDCQIGMDILGFANYLAQNNITYLEFTDGLDYVLHRNGVKPRDSVRKIIVAICMGYQESVWSADDFMDNLGLPHLDRIHTIEPSQSHAYKCVDLNGFTTARSIFAPMGRKDKRVSDSQKIKVYMHGPVEIASDVGGETHQRFIELWQQMMNSFGRPHGISFDTWLPCTVEWLEWFIKSDIQTAYYQFAESHDQSYLSKKVMGQDEPNKVCDITLKAKEGCSVCGE